MSMLLVSELRAPVDCFYHSTFTSQMLRLVGRIVLLGCSDRASLACQRPAQHAVHGVLILDKKTTLWIDDRLERGKA